VINSLPKLEKMENNENTVAPQDETQTEETIAEEVEETEAEAEEEATESDNGDDSNQHQDEVERLKTENAKLQRLLKKKDKTIKGEGLSIEETVLKAQGTPADELDYLRKVAKVENISLVDAKTNPLFVAWKEQKDARVKAEEARLGASKGSGRATAKKDFSTPNLSEEDHKALWKQINK